MVEPFYGEPRACITLNCRTAILNKGWRIHSSFIQAAAVWRISVAERIVSDRAKPALEQTLADLVSELLYVRFIGKLGPAPSLSVAAKPKQVRTDTSTDSYVRGHTDMTITCRSSLMSSVRVRLLMFVCKWGYMLIVAARF